MRELSGQFLGDPYFLGFAGGVHRPLEGERLDPDILQHIATRLAAPGFAESTYAYVMFRGRITQEKMDRVRALGAILLRYHPNNSWAARIPLAAVIPLAELPEVRWVGFARPHQKVHPVLRRMLERASPLDRLPIFVNLFESDLNDSSVKIPGPRPQEIGPGQGLVEGNPAAAGWSWATNGRVLRDLEGLGVRVGRWSEEVLSYDASALPAQIDALVERDDIAFIEPRLPARPFHDRHVPQMGHDHWRELRRVTVQTVGVIDSGFDILRGPSPQGGHVDLDKWAVGWDETSGGCGSAFCDEASEEYHGTHVLGTICGTGEADQMAYRGFSPIPRDGDLGSQALPREGVYEGWLQVHARAVHGPPWEHHSKAGRREQLLGDLGLRGRARVSRVR